MKTKLTNFKMLVFGTVLGLLAGFTVWNLNRAGAGAAVDGRLHFGLLTLVPAAQNARLNLVRIDGLEDPTEIQPCVVEIRIYDGLGRIFGTPETIELRPGVGVSRNVIPAGRTPPAATFQFRATLKFIEDPNIRNACKILPTMEVFNKETGGTLLMYPAARAFEPPPAQP